MQVSVTTYYLEILDQFDLRPSRTPTCDVRLAQVDPPMPELNRFFYTAIGGDWFWLDRLPWTYAQWMGWLKRPGVETWLLTVRGTPAGYFELETIEGNAEIVYLGLLANFVGDGLGGFLLTSALSRGWELGAHRVWVHTCSLDHPGALASYQARGLKVYKQEIATVELPEATPGPWPKSGPKTVERR